MGLRSPAAAGCCLPPEDKADGHPVLRSEGEQMVVLKARDLERECSGRIRGLDESRGGWDEALMQVMDPGFQLARFGLGPYQDVHLLLPYRSFGFQWFVSFICNGHLW